MAMITFARIPLLACFSLSLVSCCELTENSYRLDLSTTTTASAYRNTGSAQEKLSIPLKLRNLSSGNICISGDHSKDHKPQGLRVKVKLLQPNPYLSSSDAVIDYGFSANSKMRSANNAEIGIRGSKQNRAAQKLASVSEPLLGMNSDATRTGFTIHGNEALIRASFDVKWNQVPQDLLVVETPVVIEVNLSYINQKGEELPFSESFAHRIRTHLINSDRGFRNWRPFADTPKTGTFQAQQP